MLPLSAVAILTAILFGRIKNAKEVRNRTTNLSLILNKHIHSMYRTQHYDIFIKHSIFRNTQFYIQFFSLVKL